MLNFIIGSHKSNNCADGLQTIESCFTGVGRGVGGGVWEIEYRRGRWTNLTDILALFKVENILNISY